MINKGNRQQGNPYFLSSEKSMKLERVPLNEKLFLENWLQKLIDENPQILPIDEIESGFAPLISIGREISTSVGYIDNLYISPNGYLTLVETKLWRNPEAKREVVGQILDYAKELTTWTFSKINDAVKQSNELFHNKSKGIIELIKEYDLIEESDEQIIIDNIERNLKRGRLLLLIVGDGIRESVEDMVDYLQTTAQLQFTLGLVELQVYKNPNRESDLIVIPNLITRTREITRAIIKIENNNTNNLVTVETDFKEEKQKSNYSRTTITEEDFFEQLQQNTDRESVEIAKHILQVSKEKGFYIEWTTGGFVAKLLDPAGSGQKITLYVTDRKGLFYIGWSSAQLEKIGLDKQISFDFAERTAKIVGLQVDTKKKHNWNKYMIVKEMKNKFDIFINEVDKFVNEINEQSKKAND
ncbi:MAG: hypothetical protein LC105_06845 [Chitinophagales bacterium]|nr:hypothetical protein [Chitinophagales bacterium]